MTNATQIDQDTIKMVQGGIVRALRKSGVRNPQIIAALGQKLASQYPTAGGCGAGAFALAIALNTLAHEDAYGVVAAEDSDPMEHLTIAVDPKTAHQLLKEHLVVVRLDGHGGIIDSTMAVYHQEGQTGGEGRFVLFPAKEQGDVVDRIVEQQGEDFIDAVARLVVAGGVESLSNADIASKVKQLKRAASSVPVFAVEPALEAAL